MTELEPSSTSQENLGSGVSPRGTSPAAVGDGALHEQHWGGASAAVCAVADLGSPRSR